jgi:hypothetical protein
MYEQKELQRSSQRSALTKRALIGAAIAFILMSIFLMGVNHPNPAWPKFWYIRPLVVLPFAGAAGGIFYHLVNPFHYGSPWKKILAAILCLLVYIFALWMGTVLGLNGTLWN